MARTLTALLLATAPMAHAHKVAKAKTTAPAPAIEKVVCHVNDARSPVSP